MTYEQLEKIELYNSIAQFNKDIIHICKIVSSSNGSYDYYEELNKKLDTFKHTIPLDIISMTLKFNMYTIECMTVYTQGKSIDITMSNVIGFDIFETEYSMDIFEPEDITAGVILEAFLVARNQGITSHNMKLSGIPDEELEILNYDDIKSMVEQLGQLDVKRFDHKIEDDVLMLDFTFIAPWTVYI